MKHAELHCEVRSASGQQKLQGSLVGGCAGDGAASFSCACIQHVLQAMGDVRVQSPCYHSSNQIIEMQAFLQLHTCGVPSAWKYASQNCKLSLVTALGMPQSTPPLDKQEHRVCGHITGTGL